MSHPVLILFVALITFASRASFMMKPPSSPALRGSRFLEVFPVALFVAFAVSGLAAPGGQLAITPTLAAGAGGIAGAFVFRRSVPGIVTSGLVLYWIARLTF
jgi:branched-subunit amino acid transport protein